MDRPLAPEALTPRAPSEGHATLLSKQPPPAPFIHLSHGCLMALAQETQCPSVGAYLCGGGGAGGGADVAVCGEQQQNQTRSGGAWRLGGRLARQTPQGTGPIPGRILAGSPRRTAPRATRRPELRSTGTAHHFSFLLNSSDYRILRMDEDHDRMYVGSKDYILSLDLHDINKEPLIWMTDDDNSESNSAGILGFVNEKGTLFSVIGRTSRGCRSVSFLLSGGPRAMWPRPAKHFLADGSM
ncbi:hypothetical protein CRUP_028308 [Coryphaenoides rupestris]|nr:hypothetical protein CRUP_028308 [Coryphaenoides rupestris]